MKKSLKIFLPILILGCGGVLAGAIMSTSVKGADKKTTEQALPLVEIRDLQATSHQVKITSWGEIEPKEKTLLSLQVSGRVNQTHPSFIAGGIIHKGDVILTVEQDDYLTQLVESEATLANAISALEQSKAKANVAKENLKHIAINKRSALGLHQPQLNSAMAAVESAQARLKQSQRNLARTRLIAPYDALVITKNVGLGQLANAGNNLGEIYNIESAEVHLPIPKQDMLFLPDNISGLGAKLSNGKTLRTIVIDRDLGIVDSKTRMNHIIGEIRDPYGIHNKLAPLKFGQFVEIKVQAKRLTAVYLLDQDELDNEKVWLLDDDSKLKQHRVNILRTEGKQVYVSGLSNEQRLVSQPPEYPQVGMKVRTQHTLVALLSETHQEGE